MDYFSYTQKVTAKAIIPPFVIASGFLAVLLIMWEQEFKHYVPVGDHSTLTLNSTLNVDFLIKDKPSYLHFFSDECRSARVNLNHIKPIISTYQEQVNFYIINSSAISSEQLRKKYGIPDQVQILDDSSGFIAQSLEVKSLPYALIVTKDQELYFGGNYNNKNGLCGADEIIWSSPAVALNFLQEQKNPPLFPDHQLDFIGCGIF